MAPIDVSITLPLNSRASRNTDGYVSTIEVIWGNIDVETVMVVSVITLPDIKADCGDGVASESLCVAVPPREEPSRGSETAGKLHSPLYK